MNAQRLTLLKSRFTRRSIGRLLMTVASVIVTALFYADRPGMLVQVWTTGALFIGVSLVLLLTGSPIMHGKGGRKP